MRECGLKRQNHGDGSAARRMLAVAFLCGTLLGCASDDAEEPPTLAVMGNADRSAAEPAMTDSGSADEGDAAGAGSSRVVPSDAAGDDGASADPMTGDTETADAGDADITEGGAAGKAEMDATAGEAAVDASDDTDATVEAPAVTATRLVCPEDIAAGTSPFGAGPMPEVTLIQDGFRFLEGPVYFADRDALYFSDMLMGMDEGAGPPATIHRLDLGSGEISVFAERGNSNGLAIAPDGRLLAAVHDERTLAYFDLDSGEREVWPLTYMGEPFNSPNDLTARSDGQVYFSDPDWQRAGRETNINMTGFYRVDTDGQVHLLDGSLNKPNGISFSPDEQVLYVGSLDGTYRYSVQANGDVADRQLFAPVNSDGMAVDCAGNVYLTSGTVQVFTAEGASLGSLQTPGQSPTNVAFGGVDGKTLYITAGGALFAVDLAVPGSAY